MSKHEIAINIRWDSKENKSLLLVDDIAYPAISDLIPYLKERRAKDDKLRVVIRGDKLLPAIEVQRVMNLVGEGGIADISFAASNK
jgi:biopolymer transport protein ExbD